MTAHPALLFPTGRESGLLLPIHKAIHHSSQNLVQLHVKSHYNIHLSLCSCLYAHSAQLQKQYQCPGMINGMGHSGHGQGHMPAGPGEGEDTRQCLMRAHNPLCLNYTVHRQLIAQ